MKKLIKKLSVITVSLNLLACGAPDPDKEYTTYSDNSLHFYVELFIQAATASGVHVDVTDTSVSFVSAFNIPASDSTKNVVGLCQGNTRDIQILKSFWDKANNLRRKQLMFHELGHCVLGRPHVQDYLSIMLPSLMSDGKFMVHEISLTHELFYPLEEGLLLHEHNEDCHIEEER